MICSDLYISNTTPDVVKFLYRKGYLKELLSLKFFRPWGLRIFLSKYRWWNKAHRYFCRAENWGFLRIWPVCFHYLSMYQLWCLMSTKFYKLFQDWAFARRFQSGWWILFKHLSVPRVVPVLNRFLFFLPQCCGRVKCNSW